MHKSLPFKLTRKHIFVLVLFVFLNGCLCFAVYQGWWPAFQQRPAYAWEGIVPGETYADAVIRLLGSPDRIDSEDGFTLYHYRERCNRWGWETVTVWMRKKDSVVTGIHLSHLARHGLTDCRVSVEDYLTLSELVQVYALTVEPEHVGYRSCFGRAIVWSTSGIAAEVDISTLAKLEDKPVVELQLFVPANLRRYRTGQVGPITIQGPEWPLGDAARCERDPNPRDPFPWEKILEVPQP